MNETKNWTTLSTTFLFLSLIETKELLREPDPAPEQMPTIAKLLIALYEIAEELEKRLVP